MHFNPIILKDIFSPEDVDRLKNLLSSDDYEKNWVDKELGRRILKYKDLDEYFSKKLEVIVQEIFKNPKIKSTYAVYLDYNKPTSKLPAHKDNNACTYTLDYCLSSKTPWGVVVEGQEFIFGPNEGLLFMGGHDSHWREDMPDPENNRVEVIMFHFCLEDHWYFTEGPDYLYELPDSVDGDSYHLSPAVLAKNAIE